MTVEQDKTTLEEEASEAFFQPSQGEWTRADQETLEARLAADPNYALAYRRVERAWAALDAHAESPRLLARRQEAIAYARQESARQWRKTRRYLGHPWRIAAAVAGLAVLISAAWQLSPYGYHPGQYRTGIGEQRLVELDDHSRIVLDAATAVQVRYSTDGRVVELKQGQAQFSVAKDPTRPFKVLARGHTIVALGTVFRVDITGQAIHVAMMEGRVAVVPDSPSPVSRRLDAPAAMDRKTREPRGQGAEIKTSALEQGVEISAGEELSLEQDGQTRVTPKADLEAATAWREGRIIFRNERLSDAVQRLNRYSRLQIEIADQALAAQEISGVFEAGDTQGFVRDIQRYLPVVAESDDADRIKLRTR